MERPKWLKESQDWSKTEKCSHHTVSKHIKALRALYDSQAANYQDGPEAFKVKYGAKPNDGKELNGLKRQQKNTVAETRQKLHKPRGKAALAMEGYTRDQNQQLLGQDLLTSSERVPHWKRVPYRME